MGRVSRKLLTEEEEEVLRRILTRGVSDRIDIVGKKGLRDSDRIN